MKNSKAQEYINTLYGTNKERDSKENHSYYLGIIQGLLTERFLQKRMIQDKYSWIDLSVEKPKDGDLVLAKTIGEPIVRFVVCEWIEELGIFCDYDEYPFDVSHWIKVNNIQD